MRGLLDRPQIEATDCHVQVRSLRLHYVDYGGDGEPVIGLPGLTQTARAYDAIAPVLSPHVRLIALDFRGRGGSEWGPASQYNTNHYLLDLQQFAAALGLEKFALIGTSLGGLIAKLYATAHPARVSRLVLNDWSQGTNFDGLLRVLKRYSDAPSEFADLDDATRWFRSRRDGLERLDPETLSRWVGQYLAPTATGTLRFACDPELLRAKNEQEFQGLLSRATMAWSNSWMGWEFAKRLSMPLLVIRGAESDVVTRENVERLVRTLPDARFVDVPGVGHSPTLYEPEAQAAVRGFFEIPE